MGKFDGFLLVSDFDDTLYGTRNQIPRRSLQALDSFIEQGGRFTVATGRAHRTFAPYAHLAPINAPVILSNGSALYDFAQEKMLYQTFLPPCAVHDLALLSREIPQLALEAYHAEDIYVFNPNCITQFHMERVGTGYIQCPVEEMPSPWTKAILQQDRPLLLKARRWLEEHCPGRYEAIFSNAYYLEITEKGSHKGSMVTLLAQQLGISPQRVYCVGDNQNDIPMLEISAIPFAPANCAQEVVNSGARILCHCDEGVIGDVVEYLDGVTAQESGSTQP